VVGGSVADALEAVPETAAEVDRPTRHREPTRTAVDTLRPGKRTPGPRAERRKGTMSSDEHLPLRHDHSVDIVGKRSLGAPRHHWTGVRIDCAEVVAAARAESLELASEVDGLARDCDRQNVPVRALRAGDALAHLDRPRQDLSATPVERGDTL